LIESGWSWPDLLLATNNNERNSMLKYIRALSVAGLTTLSSSQAALADGQNVIWSPDKDQGEVIVAGIKEAARAISQANNHHPMVRFTSSGAGGMALVPIWPYEIGDRCSPNFDTSPFRVEKGKEVWANFEFVNIDPGDRDLMAFTIKAEKPGCKPRYRVEHDIANGRSGNKSSMSAMVAVPAEGDYGYYFQNRGILQTDDIVQRNPGAAIRITISNHAPGRAA
jgi:hypothetical protein